MLSFGAIAKLANKEAIVDADCRLQILEVKQVLYKNTIRIKATLSDGLYMTKFGVLPSELNVTKFDLIVIKKITIKPILARVGINSEFMTTAFCVQEATVEKTGLNVQIGHPKNIEDIGREFEDLIEVQGNGEEFVMPEMDPVHEPNAGLIHAGDNEGDFEDESQDEGYVDT